MLKLRNLIVDNKKRIILAIIILEIALVALASIKFSKVSANAIAFTGADMSEETEDCSTKYRYETNVPRGIYLVTIKYQQGEIEDGNAYSAVMNTNNGEMLSDLVPLFDYTDVSSYRFYADDSTNPIRISCVTTDNTITTRIDHISIVRLDGISLFWRLMKFVFVFLLFDGACLYILYLYLSDEKARWKSLSLFGVILISILPIILVKVGRGDDIRDHIVRLKSIADELSKGHFPVRMSSMLYNGYGYPFNVFYPYLLYLIPALLHLIGMPLGMAYEVYMIIVTVLTIFICYYSFRTVAQDDYVGIWGAAIYTMVVWRFANCFNRGAVGEYTAMTFLPLLFLAFYRFTKKDENKIKAEIEFIIAYTMLFQSHMLTTVISTFIMIILSLVFIRELFARDNIVRLVRTGIITFLVNAWYLIPLVNWYAKFDMILQNEYNDIGASWVDLSKMISLRMTSFDIAGKVKYELPKNPGLAIFMVLFVSLVFIIVKRPRENKKWTYTMLLMSLLNLFMITRFFPYDIIKRYVGPLYKLLNSVQHSMRYNTYIMIFVVMLGVLVASSMDRSTRSFSVYVAVTITASVVSWLALTDQYVSLHRMQTIVDGSNYGSYPYDYLYLLKDTDIDSTRTHELYTSDCVEAIRVYGDTEYQYQICNDGDMDGYVDVDMLMYDGYRANVVDGTENANIKLSYGKNNRVRVEVPGGFKGNVIISFHEPWYWRGSELISFISIVGSVLFYTKKNKAHK